MRGLVVVAMLAVGCSAPLGSNDVELALTSPTHHVASAVRQRLVLHSINAEVEQTGDDVVVRLDGSRADVAERLLTHPADLVLVRDGAPLIPFAVPRARVDGKHVIVSLTPREITQLSHVRPGDVAIKYGMKVWWSGPLATCVRGDELDILAGDDISGYARARELGKVIISAPLPPLTLRSRVALPIEWSLLLGVILLPIAVAIVWIFFVRRFDRARPEPWWLVIATVALGALTTPIAGLVEKTIRHLTPYLDHDVMSLDLSARAFPLGLLVFTLCVGVIEEGLKLLAAWSLAMHRKEFDEPIDGIVFAAAAAIGFATAENVLYFTQDRFGGGLFTVRSLTCVSGHFMYAAIWGYALGQRIANKRVRVWPYFLLAAALHGAWDTFVTFGQRDAQSVMMIALTLGFTVLARRALRWGVITTPPSGERILFRLGRTPGFLVAVFAMFAFGWRLEEVAIDAGHGRIDLAFVGWLALYGTLFVAAAWALTALLPLDVAIDDAGLTFGGATRNWADVHTVTRSDDNGLVVDDLRLRPGPKATIDRLEAELQRRMSSTKR